MYNQDQLKQKEVSTPPDNYLVWAVLSTVLCCMPLGIVSIIKSSDVNKKWAMGDYEGAQKASRDAKKYAIYGAVSGVVVLIIYFILAIVFGIGGALLNGDFN